MSSSICKTIDFLALGAQVLRPILYGNHWHSQCWISRYHPSSVLINVAAVTYTIARSSSTPGKDMTSIIGPAPLEVEATPYIQLTNTSEV